MLRAFRLKGTLAVKRPATPTDVWWPPPDTPIKKDQEQALHNANLPPYAT